MRLRSAEILDDRDAKPTVLTVRVSDKIGAEEFAVPVRTRASNFVLATGGCSQIGGIRSTYQAVSVTLDFLLEHSLPPQISKRTTRAWRPVR